MQVLQFLLVLGVRSPFNQTASVSRNVSFIISLFQHTDSQPPWLAVALAPLQEQINTIQAKLNTIQAQVTQIAGRQADFIRTMAKVCYVIAP